jgi:Permuted papain-like amidase enzyme, YaeF/YiiX, C92 family
MKKLFAALMLCVLAAAAGLYAASADDRFPPLNDGDLVFQTSTSNQSAAILLATADPFSHMGIVKHIDGDIVVVEASDHVKETPLRVWVNRGLFKRVAIYRDTQLTQEQIGKILASAKAMYGKPYDIFFSFNNDAIYCSELPYLAFKAAGVSIGRIQKLSELHFDNALVKRLIRQRWQRDTECTSNGYDFEQCYQHLLDQDLITPASIASDSQFKRIYSNYPF